MHKPRAADDLFVFINNHSWPQLLWVVFPFWKRKKVWKFCDKKMSNGNCEPFFNHRIVKWHLRIIWNLWNRNSYYLHLLSSLLLSSIVVVQPVCLKNVPIFYDLQFTHYYNNNNNNTTKMCCSQYDKNFFFTQVRRNSRNKIELVIKISSK